ncbi:N,N-dimethyltransferase (plasmid) [Paraburkholderia caribensis]|nr:N,N-dimethyltransferase [Paraburkholderia caribensis]AUT58009.1 class I SAM-dependent methyltransferase [Paraburkholderia caribensis]
MNLHSDSKSRPLLYGELAQYYDLIHARHDYRSQASAIHDVLSENGVPDGSKILEAACGTGNYLIELQRHYTVSGFDLSEEMLRQARRKLTGMSLFEADIKSFKCTSPVSAILCLCSSVAYLRSYDELRDAFSSCACALNRGGLLVIRPWLEPDQVVEGMMWMDYFEGEEIKLCRQAVLRRHDRDSILDFHWLVAKPETGVTHYLDRHVLRLFEHREIERALTTCGLNCRQIDVRGFDRSLWIAHRD